MLIPYCNPAGDAPVTTKTLLKMMYGQSDPKASRRNNRNAKRMGIQCLGPDSN
jgi:hypothetical protein